MQIKIGQDYLSYAQFTEGLKGLNLVEWYLTYINDLRVSEDGQNELEFRIKPKLECFPSQAEHSLDLKVYTTDQNSLKLTPDQLKFAESDADSLTLAFTNENSSDYQEFSIVAVDDEWAEKSSIAFMYLIVENENKTIENIGDLGDVPPFLVSAIFLEDNDEVIQVQSSSAEMKSKDLQKFSLSLQTPLDEVSDTYVLVTLQGDKGRLLDPSYAEESSTNGNVEGFARDYILFELSYDTWESEEYTFFVQAMDEGDADLHFLTFNDELLNIITHSFDSLFANDQKYLSGQFPKLTEFDFNSPINCSANQDCIFSVLPHILLFQLVNEWVNSFMDLDDFLTEVRQEGSPFNTFIAHYPFPDEFNFFQLFDDIGGIEYSIINYMQFKIRDSSDPYLGIKHTERIEDGPATHPDNGTGGGGGWTPSIPSGNADLADLGVYIGTDNILEGFAGDETIYHVETEADSIALTFEPAHNGASLFVNDEQVEGRIQIELEEGENTIELVVRAENGEEKRYVLTINRLKIIPFPDIENHWAKDYIKTSYRNGWFKGYSNGDFGPENHVTRMQIASLFVRILGLTERAAIPFTDIHRIEAVTLEELEKAYANGVVNGFTDETFKPYQAVTRAQLARMMYRSFEKVTGAPYQPKQLADIPDIHRYDQETQDAIAMLVELGIAEGSEGNFLPNNRAKRAHAAKMLVNFKEVLDGMVETE